MYRRSDRQKVIIDFDNQKNAENGISELVANNQSTQSIQYIHTVHMSMCIIYFYFYF